MTTRRETECPLPQGKAHEGRLVRDAMFRLGTLPGRLRSDDAHSRETHDCLDGLELRRDQRIGEAESFTSPSQNAYVPADLRTHA